MPYAALRCAVGLALVFVLAPYARADAIDDFVGGEMAKRNIPGLALVVSKDGKVVKTGAYGRANLETESPVTRESVFELASLTKQFTAAAVMLLVRDGKVRLDDPLSAYVANTPESWKTITVRHLLTHTAGFPDQFPEEREGTYLMDDSTANMFATVAGTPLLFPPGTRAQYSDPGYFLLGMVIERASGKPYGTFLAERFFKPLGMTSSHVIDQWAIVKNRVAGYTMREGKLLNGRRDWQVELPSHYGVMSTIDDMARWEAALAAGTLLDRASLDQMWKPARLADGRQALVFGSAYGFGWMLGDVRGHRSVEHGGFSGTHMLRFPDDGLTVVVLTNLDIRSGSQPQTIARGVAGLVDPALLPPHMLTAKPDPEPSATVRLRAMLDDIASGREPEAMTPPQRSVFAGLPPPIRDGLVARLRTLQSFTYIDRDDVTSRGMEVFGTKVVRIAYYRGRDAQSNRIYTFWLTADGQVADMRSYAE
jgi:D-alanyl-D-alanine carboxypeptidase